MRLSYSAATDNSTTYAFSGYSLAPTNLSAFTSTSETIMIGEPPDSLSHGLGYAMSTPGIVFANSYGGKPGDLHLTGANYLWVDGHVKWLRPEKTTQTINGVANYYWLRVKP